VRMASQHAFSVHSPCYDELISHSESPDYTNSATSSLTALGVVDALITPALSPATARYQAAPVRPTFSGWMRKQARSFPYALQSKYVESVPDPNHVYIEPYDIHSLRQRPCLA